MKRIEKQRELLRKAYELRNIAYMGYERQQEIREYQNTIYKRWKFYKNLGEALDKVKV